MPNGVQITPSPTRYTRAACSAAIANPLHWVTLSNVRRPGKIRQQILTSTGPNLLRARNVDGRFDVYETNGEVWLRFIYPWQETEVGRRPPGYKRRRPREAPAGSHDEPSGASTAAITDDTTAGVNP